MTMIKMIDVDLKGKRLFIRADLNVPLKAGKITSDARIRAALPTVITAFKQGAKLMITSHLGRPTEGEYDQQFSLQPVADQLQALLHQQGLLINVRLVKDYLAGVNITDNEVVMLENVRFNIGEKKNDPQLAKKYAALCDVFVMDAFGTAHRAQASTYGIAEFATTACAGPLLVTELDALTTALANPAKPMVAIVGGSKVSTKLMVLNSLAKIADKIIVGGGIANTFLAAQGYCIGNSLYEPDLIPEAKKLLLLDSNKAEILLPTDVRVAKSFSEAATAEIKTLDKIQLDEQILDFGDQSAHQLAAILRTAKTILWNGPVGVFEFPHFRPGTEIIAHAIAQSDAFSIAGGGDTLAAIDMFGIAQTISYISTGGGAFLEFVEGKKLPAVAILMERAKKSSTP